MKKLFYIVSFILLLAVVGCSTNKSQVTSKIFELTQQEENELRAIAYQSLSNSVQKEIVDWEQAEISAFKSGSEFELFNSNTNQTEDIKDVQALLISFEMNEDSELESIKVYVNENGEKVLGSLVENK